MSNQIEERKGCNYLSVMNPPDIEKKLICIDTMHSDIGERVDGIVPPLDMRVAGCPLNRLEFHAMKKVETIF
jgi:hypothetical protein